RRHPFRRRLRNPDAAEKLSPENEDQRMTIPNRNFNFPTAIRFGSGRISELAEHCRANGIERPLFVTDPGLAGMPMVKDILARLKAERLGVDLFSNVRPNPVESNIAEGVAA